jgi:hypothetical protein
MAFNDTYVESIQTKHVSNVGFTSTAKGVTNEAFALKNPHQVLSSQIPFIDVIGTYGPLVTDGIAADVAEEHIVKLTADPTVNNNKAWIAYETNCTISGHSGRGAVRVDKWMRYAETQYKLRLYEDNGSTTAPDYTKEILPSEVNFNWEYDASAGIVYFDADPDVTKTMPLWGVFYTYIGGTVEEAVITAANSIPEISYLGFDCTYIDDYNWTYNSGGGLIDVPASLSVFVNGVKQRDGDPDYYTATVNSGTGIMNLEFGFQVQSDDWVSIEYLIIDSTSNGSPAPMIEVGGSTKVVNQIGHGFSVGDVLYLVGTVYTKAIATAISTSEVVGIVSSIEGSNSFALSNVGHVKGMSGLTAGTTYFLSDSSPGAISSTAPTTDGHVSKPIFIADSVSSGYFFNMRGVTIGELEDLYYTKDEVDTISGSLNTKISNVSSVSSTPSADAWSGPTITNITSSATLGQLCYINSSGEAVLADADSASTMPGTLMATSVSGTFLLTNSVVHLHTLNPGWTKGQVVYAGSGATSTHTSGAISQGIPNGSGDQIQAIGMALDTDILLFTPSLVTIELV